MTDFRRICCPIDFSDVSHVALEEAAAVARRYGAGLFVLHVEDQLQVGAEMVFAPPPGPSGKDLPDRLASWAADAERIRGGTVGSVLLSGPAAPAIVQFVRDSGIDLVVMASHGRKGLGRLVMGSVAELVVRNSPCDVLIVRRDEPAAAAEKGDATTGMPA